MRAMRRHELHGVYDRTAQPDFALYKGRVSILSLYRRICSELSAKSACLGARERSERVTLRRHPQRHPKAAACIKTVGKNTAAIKEYIATQLKKDKESEQLSIFDPRNPFTGSK